MATLTFQFDTGNVPLIRIVDAICLEYNYQAVLADGTANPETKAIFAKKTIGNIIKNMVINQDKMAATNTAIATVTPIVLT